MPDPDAALRADVDAVRACRLLPGGVGVEGWRYDVDTGEIVQVVRPVSAGPRPTNGRCTGPVGNLGRCRR